MKQRAWWVFLAALALMAGTGMVLHRAGTRQHLGAPGVKLVNEPTYGEDGRLVMPQSVYLPPSVLGASSTSVPISKLELIWLPADTTYGRRLYEWPDDRKLLVSVVLMGSDRTSIHKPEFCLNGQGWEYKASDTEVIQVPMTRPVEYSLPVMKVQATKTMQTPRGEVTLRGMYLYWFVTDQEISALHTRRVWSQTLHMLRTGELQRWAYISLFTTCLPGQEAPTVEWMTRWIQEAAPQFQVPPAAPAPPRAQAVP
jgi:hypothetical protein